MMDIKYIKENLEEMKKVVKDKQINLDLEKLIKIANKRSKLLQKIELTNSQRKKTALKQDRETGSKLKKDLQTAEGELAKIEPEFIELMLLVPNIFDKSTPIGGEEANKVVFEHGKPTSFDFKPKDHIQIGKDLDLIDAEKGVKTSGFRGYYLKNQLAQLHLAILLYAFNKIILKGYEPFIPPTLLKDFALIGSGHFPSGYDEVYQIGNPVKISSGDNIKDPLYLAGTSEPSVLAYFSDKVFDEKELPKRCVGFSQCYRSEVGSYGKDTNGIFRIHEFAKVEQVAFTTADTKVSNKMLEELLNNSKEILEDLELPYRVIQIASGDMGAGKYKMYDIETWFPSRKGYGETHSDSNLTDWQPRRLNIKYIDVHGTKKYVHALNNTAIASPRILIALLENHQQKDGSIKIPKCLVNYCGFDKIKAK